MLIRDPRYKETVLGSDSDDDVTDMVRLCTAHIFSDVTGGGATAAAGNIQSTSQHTKHFSRSDPLVEQGTTKWFLGKPGNLDNMYS